MISITVNGARHALENPTSVCALLERLEMAGKKIAVERNGEIIPKSLHPKTLVQDGDALEIVVAVGGG